VAQAEPCIDLPSAEAPSEAERFVAHIAARAADPLAGDLPGLTAHVTRWGARGDTVFTELHYVLPLGRRAIRWNAVKRFQLREGRAATARSYEDRLVRLQRPPTHPLLIPRLLRTPLAPV
jgi:hypothetical protein